MAKDSFDWRCEPSFTTENAPSPSYSKGVSAVSVEDDVRHEVSPTQNNRNSTQLAHSGSRMITVRHGSEPYREDLDFTYSNGIRHGVTYLLAKFVELIKVLPAGGTLGFCFCL